MIWLKEGWLEVKDGIWFKASFFCFLWFVIDFCLLARRVLIRNAAFWRKINMHTCHLEESIDLWNLCATECDRHFLSKKKRKKRIGVTRRGFHRRYRSPRANSVNCGKIIPKFSSIPNLLVNIIDSGWVRVLSHVLFGSRENAGEVTEKLKKEEEKLLVLILASAVSSSYTVLRSLAADNPKWESFFYFTFSLLMFISLISHQTGGYGSSRRKHISMEGGFFC